MTMKATSCLFDWILSLAGMDHGSFLGMTGVRSARLEVSSYGNHAAETTFDPHEEPTVLTYKRKATWTKQDRQALRQERRKGRGLDRFTLAALHAENREVCSIDFDRNEVPQAIICALREAATHGGLSAVKIVLHLWDGETVVCRVNRDHCSPVFYGSKPFDDGSVRIDLSPLEIDHILTKYGARSALPAFSALCLTLWQPAAA